MNAYYRVADSFTNEIIIKKSRFIATLIPIKNSAEAEDNLKILSKKYSDATHNCYAYISNAIATEMKCSDDGEPQGTAGIPILEVLKKRDIRLTLAVVTRYFGGIKLGASGLVGAYSEAIKEALNKAKIRIYKYSIISSITIGYNLYKMVEEIIHNADGRVIELIFEENVRIVYSIPMEMNDITKNKLKELTLGQSEIQILNKDYVDYEINSSGGHI